MSFGVLFWYRFKGLLLLREILLHERQLKGESLPANFVPLITKTKGKKTFSATVLWSDDNIVSTGP